MNCNTTHYRANSSSVPGDPTYLLDKGFKPDVLVLGLTWRNVARDTAIRHDIAQVFGDEAFVASFRARVRDAGVEAALTPMIDAEARRSAHDRELERQRSTADRLDEQLAGPVGRAVALIGESAELRASLYRAAAYRVAGLAGNKATELRYDVVPEDLEVNRMALAGLIRMLRRSGATVIVYLAPERTDLPPLMLGEQQHAFIDELKQLLAENEGTLVDARDAVPNDFWGWEAATPDRSHFTEPGHKLLARRLVELGEQARAFTALGAP